MLTAAQLRPLLSGAQRGVTPSLVRGALCLAEFPYALAVAARNQAYDRRTPQPIPVPVISVGNLTVGGVGKTPLVAWLARWFRQRSVRVCVISRGYGAEAGARNDEALELEQRLPDVPHLQNPDRLAAAATALEEFESELLILDDAFQHRRIHRDLDLVLLDALEPFGYGHLLPRGLLREPLSALRRSQVVALTRADAVTPQRREEIRRIVFSRAAPQTTWLEMSHQPLQLISSSGAAQPLDAWRGARVAAFCGVGNPAGFRHTLQAAGLTVLAFREFPDHHPYSAEDVHSLAVWGAAQPEIRGLVCTQKDLVKLRTEQLGNRPLWALQIGIEIQQGLAELESHLERLLKKCQGQRDVE